MKYKGYLKGVFLMNITSFNLLLYCFKSVYGITAFAYMSHLKEKG